jgi:hypothetical protein
MTDPNQVTWASNIKDMLAPYAPCMKGQMNGKYQLDDYENVKFYVQEIWAVLNGSPVQMPPSGPLPEAQLSMFKSWMDNDCPP